MTKQVYYIDEKILAVFNNTQSAEDSEKQYSAYLEQVDILRVVAVQAFLSSKGLGENSIDDYTNFVADHLDEFSNSVTGELSQVNPTSENSTEQVDLEKMTFIDNILSSQEANDFVETYLEGFNRSLYEKADKTLTVDQKKELNTYLQTVDQDYLQMQQEAKQYTMDLIKAQRAKESQVSEPATIPSVNTDQPEVAPGTPAVPVAPQPVPTTPSMPQINLTQQHPQQTPQPVPQP